jgi:hypothetical protein
MWLQPPAHADSSLANFSTLKMEAIRSSETSAHTRTTRRHSPEAGILHSHCRGNLNCYVIVISSPNSANRVDFFSEAPRCVAVLPLRIQPPVVIGHEAGRAPEPLCKLWWYHDHHHNHTLQYYKTKPFHITRTSGFPKLRFCWYFKLSFRMPSQLSFLCIDLWILIFVESVVVIISSSLLRSERAWTTV